MKLIYDNNLYLETLRDDNCDWNAYLKWMNDYNITKFTMSRFKGYVIEDLKKYIVISNEEGFLFGIFYKNQHIGNLRISKITSINKTCELGLIIGEKSYWGKGIATKVVSIGKDFIFKYLDLFKIKAEIIEINKASINVFKKNHFKVVGRMEKEFFIEGNRYDTLWMEVINLRYLK